VVAGLLLWLAALRLCEAWNRWRVLRRAAKWRRERLDGGEWRDNV
jgi:hypothetical protein